MDEQIQAILVIGTILIFSKLLLIAAVLITNKITDAKEFNRSKSYKEIIQILEALYEEKKKRPTMNEIRVMCGLPPIKTNCNKEAQNGEDQTIKVLSKEQHDEIHNIPNKKLREQIIKIMKEGKTLGEAAKEVGVAFSFSAKGATSEQATNNADFFNSIIIVEVPNENI